MNFSRMILIKEFLYKKDINTTVVEGSETFEADVVSVDDLKDCCGINLDTPVDGVICYTLYPERIIAEDSSRVIASFEYVAGSIPGTYGGLVRKTMILYKK